MAPVRAFSAWMSRAFPLQNGACPFSWLEDCVRLAYGFATEISGFCIPCTWRHGVAAVIHITAIYELGHRLLVKHVLVFSAAKLAAKKE